MIRFVFSFYHPLGGVLLLSACMACTPVLAQNAAMETAAIEKSREAGFLTKIDAQQRKKQLENLIEEGYYPALHFDSTTQKFRFEWAVECPGVSKDVLFSRLKAWCAFQFPEEAAQPRLSEPENGLLIVNGYTYVSYNDATRLNGGLLTSNTYFRVYHRCGYALVFEVRDGGFSVRYEQLSYRMSSGGFTSGNVYVPKVAEQQGIEVFFPVMLHSPERRRQYLALVAATVNDFEATQKALKTYILAGK
jgi:hypothetical protein